MKTFRMIYLKDCTKSAVIRVQANSGIEAIELGYEQAQEGDVEWDDDTDSTARPYLCDESLEEIDEAELLLESLEEFIGELLLEKGDTVDTNKVIADLRHAIRRGTGE